MKAVGTLGIDENLDLGSEELIKNKGSLVLGVILIVVAVIMVISIIRTILNFRNQKDGYTRYIDKILFEWSKAGIKTGQDVEKNRKKRNENRDKQDENIDMDIIDYNWFDDDDE